MNYTKAFFSFFGINPNELKEKVIITNINTIYKCLIEKSEVPVSVLNRGFCKCGDVSFNGILFSLIKVLPGNNVIDVVKLVSKYCDTIYFLGIAGCLNPKTHNLGDVCSPNCFLNSVGSLKNAPGLMTICQTDGLVHDTEFYEKLRDNGVQLVDMECFDINSLCIEYGVKLKYVVQISDFPIELPFYKAKEMPINIKDMLECMGLSG